MQLYINWLDWCGEPIHIFFYSLKDTILKGPSSSPSFYFNNIYVLIMFFMLHHVRKCRSSINEFWCTALHRHYTSRYRCYIDDEDDIILFGINHSFCIVLHIWFIYYWSIEYRQWNWRDFNLIAVVLHNRSSITSWKKILYCYLIIFNVI